MASTSRSTTHHGPGSSDEFAHRVQLGGDLLQQGKLADAREQLEQALALQPKSQKVQSLLGLACFKLGVLDRAAEMYELLVRENPVEPTLRVNLGLVYLKTGDLSKAIKEFQTGVDLAPEHKKGQNYLGLALAQAGEYARAREAFIAAGSISMIEKMDKALAEAHASAPAEAPRSLDLNGFADSAPTGTFTIPNFAALQAAAAAPPPMPAPAHAHPPSPITLTPASAPAAPVELGPPPSHGATLGDLAQVLKLSPVLGPAFQVQGNLVAIRVAGEVLTRLEGYVGQVGPVTLQPEMKRFRGRATDKPFGKGSRRFVRASGQGLLWVSTGKKLFLPVEVGENAAYFAEEAVFAFEEALTFENGRLPGKNVPDVNLIHLRGRGKVLLGLEGPLRSVEVNAQQPVQLAAEQLVGWIGGLTPKIVQPLPELEGEPTRLAVELTGEGFALLCLPEPK